MTDIEGFLTIYGHSNNLLNNKRRIVGRIWMLILGLKGLRTVPPPGFVRKEPCNTKLRVRFFGKIQIRILVSKNGFCVSLPKSENGLITD